MKWNMKIYLSGEAGKILTTTDASGNRTGWNQEKTRQEPEDRQHALRISLDIRHTGVSSSSAASESNGRKTRQKEFRFLLMNPQNGDDLCLCKCTGI